VVLLSGTPETYLCYCTAHTPTIDITNLFLYWSNIEGTQYCLDDKLYHMGQVWDLYRFTTPIIIDIQLLYQLLKLLPHSVIIPRIIHHDI